MTARPYTDDDRDDEDEPRTATCWRCHRPQGDTYNTILIPDNRAGGMPAHHGCIATNYHAPSCAVCDQPEGDTEWGRFVPCGDSVAHAGCELDRNSSMADDYMLGAIR